MARAELPARLDAAVAQSRITLVIGLPRAGRSALISRWARGRTDAALVPFDPDGDDVASIMIFDHLTVDDVDGFIRRFRSAEQAEARTRFVAAPVDLTVTDRLGTALSGSVLTLDLSPLQLDDFIAEAPVLSSADGPISGLVAEPVPTNTPAYDAERHWLRGGLPESLAADTDHASLVWRRGLIATLLARDYSSWDVPRASRLPEILRWAANQNGGELDDTACPVAKRADLRSALYVFDRQGVVRRLPNYPAGSSSSLGKKPKLFVRDSGILHAILGIETAEQLRNHPDVGDSWEGYAIEALIGAGADRCSSQFYRAMGSDGEDEIDLVLDFRALCGKLVAIECKVSPEQSARVGFYRGCEAIGATDRFVVHSGAQAILADPVDRIDLLTALSRIGAIASTR